MCRLFVFVFCFPQVTGELWIWTLAHLSVLKQLVDQIQSVKFDASAFLLSGCFLDLGQLVWSRLFFWVVFNSKHILDYVVRS